MILRMMMIAGHLFILDHTSHMMMEVTTNTHLSVDTLSGIYQDVGVDKVDDVSGVCEDIFTRVVSIGDVGGESVPDVSVKISLNLTLLEIKL